MSKKANEYELEKEKLLEVFGGLDENTLKVVSGLIDNASFMGVELRKLQKHIAENGYTEEYQNGPNQFMRKKSTEADMYNTITKNYTSVIKQLAEYLPKGVAKSAATSMLDFIAVRR